MGSVFSQAMDANTADYSKNSVHKSHRVHDRFLLLICRRVLRFTQKPYPIAHVLRLSNQSIQIVKVFIFWLESSLIYQAKIIPRKAIKRGPLYHTIIPRSHQRPV